MSDYISTLPDSTSIIWTTQDVMRIVPDLNEDQARAVLSVVLYWHNPKKGVTEDIIADTAYQIFLKDNDE